MDNFVGLRGALLAARDLDGCEDKVPDDLTKNVKPWIPRTGQRLERNHGDTVRQKLVQEATA